MNARSIFVNALTFSRLPLTFAWLVLAFFGDGAVGWPRVALAVAALAALTLSGFSDLADGLLARRWKVVTALGKMADPLMDKAVYVIVFPALTYFAARVPGPKIHAVAILAFTILYILRDLWVTFLRSVGSMYGADVAAMMLGKIRTALTFPVAAFIYAYIAFSPMCTAPLAVLWLRTCYVLETAMIFLNIYSFYAYTCAYAPFVKKALAQNSEI